VVGVSTSPTFSFANPMTLPIRRSPPLFLGEREYDAFSGGQRFLFALPVNTTMTGNFRQVQFVINWFEELKRRVKVEP
jgi:hypothetical protein